MLKRTGECTHCSECCTGNSSNILTEDQKIEYKKTNFNYGFCYYFDREKMRCKIYEMRPDICRRFPESIVEITRNCTYKFEEVD